MKINRESELTIRKLIAERDQANQRIIDWVEATAVALGVPAGSEFDLDAGEFRKPTPNKTASK